MCRFPLAEKYAYICGYFVEVDKMGNKLKHFRIAVGMTQAEVAKAIGVTQPTYQRWEAGSVDIPKVKLAKLTKVLKTTSEALLGRHPPIMAAFYDDRAPKHLQYYGEVAIHFRSGNEPLLLSISEEARSRLYQNLHLDSKFVTLKDLGNRTLVIRKNAIADLYLSSGAYDDFGPEHDEPGYKDGTPIQFPDTRDWEIIECLAYDSEDIENFSEEDVKRVEEGMMITDKQYEKLVADGHIAADELETEKEKNTAITKEIFEMATDLVYQLSTGKRRSIAVIDFNLYEAFGDLVEENSDEEEFIIFQSAGYHRSIFINPDALDYISMPTHILERDHDEFTDKLLGER
jgi:transcriptional regulator with XRE-family HTH domain